MGSAFLGPGSNGPQMLRALVDGPGLAVAPGAYDALSARLVEAAGFPAVYMTGFGTAASFLGRPDAGLLDMGEMVGNAGRMAAAVSVPVLADADTGYGNPVNVIRTVRAYEQAGVGGVHIEDQVAPKRCGHTAGKQVVAAGEMRAKIEAAVAARRDPDFVIVARTDARAVEGLSAAIDRAASYAEAGADVLFVEAPETEAEIESVAKALAGVPLLLNMAEGGRTPRLPLGRLEELGFRIVLFPIGTMLAATRAMKALLEGIREAEAGGAAGATRPEEFRAFLDFIGMPEIRALEQRFSGGGAG